MVLQSVHDRIYMFRSLETTARVTTSDSRHHFRDGVFTPRFSYEFDVEGIRYSGFGFVQTKDRDEKINVSYIKGNPEKNCVSIDPSNNFGLSMAMSVFFGALGVYCYITGSSARRLRKYQDDHRLKPEDRMKFEGTSVSHFYTVMAACAVALALNYLTFRLFPFSPFKPLSETSILSLKWICFLASVTLVVFSVSWKAYASGVIFLVTGVLGNPFTLNRFFWEVYSNYYLVLIGFIIYATVKLRAPNQRLRGVGEPDAC